MNLKTTIKLASRNVRANRLRSWLTVLGIIIGIASVMIIVSAGDLVQKEISKAMDSFGAEVITMRAQVPNGLQKNSMDEIETNPLTDKEVIALRDIHVVKYVNPVISYYVEVEYGKEQTEHVKIKGVDPEQWSKFTTKKPSTGRLLRTGDRKSAVIRFDKKEYNLQKEQDKVKVDDFIYILGQKYRVVGIILETSFEGNIIYVSMEDARFFSEILEDSQGQGEDDQQVSDENKGKNSRDYDKIEILLHEDADHSESIIIIKEKMRMLRKVTEKTQNFEIYSMAEMVEEEAKAIKIVTAVLALIAGISLLVGSIGIANSMFTTVVEKTKEIGVMKAIGAKERDIKGLFLMQSVFLGLFGGIIGIISGALIFKLMIIIASYMLNVEISFILSIKATLIAVSVSIIVGIIAGYIPAKNASELDPVDALKAE